MLLWDCIDVLSQIGRQNRVILACIPEQQADELAQEGASMDLTGP